MLGLVLSLALGLGGATGFSNTPHSNLFDFNFISNQPDNHNQLKTNSITHYKTFLTNSKIELAWGVVLGPYAGPCYFRTQSEI